MPLIFADANKTGVLYALNINSAFNDVGRGPGNNATMLAHNTACPSTIRSVDKQVQDGNIERGVSHDCC